MPTGFLGNGKTTLLRHLLGHPAIKETAAVINAFGEIGLDHLLVTKTDLAKDGAAAALEARLGALNPAAPRHRVAHGEIEPTRPFHVGLYSPESKSLDARRWLKAEAYAAAMPEGHGHHYHDVNRHNARIRAFCITRDLERETFKATLRDFVDDAKNYSGARPRILEEKSGSSGAVLAGSR